MTDSVTVNYSWAYPTPNADADTWGATLNTTIIAIDAQVKIVSDAIATGDNLRLSKASKLSDLGSASTARTNLGLGAAAVKGVLGSEANVATVQSFGSGQLYASASDGTMVNSGVLVTSLLLKQNDLAGLNSTNNARNNLGLGSAATRNVYGGVATYVASVATAGLVSGSLPTVDSNRDLTNSGIATTSLLLKQNDLAGLNSASNARSNLGLANGATTGISGATGSGAPSGGNDGDVFFRYV